MPPISKTARTTCMTGRAELKRLIRAYEKNTMNLERLQLAPQAEVSIIGRLINI
jgi:hypothetical protein